MRNCSIPTFFLISFLLLPMWVGCDAPSSSSSLEDSERKAFLPNVAVDHDVALSHHMAALDSLVSWSDSSREWGSEPQTFQEARCSVRPAVDVAPVLGIEGPVVPQLVGETPQKALANTCRGIDAIYNGPLYIYSMEELQMARQYREVHGDIIIPGIFDQAALDLPCLKVLKGSLLMPGCGGGEGFKQIRMSRLEEVTGDFQVFNSPGLERVYLPMLTTVKDLLIEANESLGEVNLPALEWVSGDLTITHGRLESLELPELVSVGGALSVRILSELDEFSFPKLEEADYLVLTHLDSLPSFTFPELASLEGVILRQNDALSEFDLPFVTELSGASRIHDNALLSQFEMPYLVSAGQLEIYSNDQLEEIHFSSLESVENLFFESKPGQAFMPVREIRLPALETVGETVRLSRLLDLEELWIPYLEDINGGFSAVEVPALEAIKGPSLRHLGWVLLDELLSLQNVSFPSMETVDSHFIVTGGLVLEEVFVPQLSTIGGDLHLENNPVLAEQPFTVLDFVGNMVTIIDNDSLSQCVVDALLEHLSQAMGEVPEGTWGEGNWVTCGCAGSENLPGETCL